MAALVEAIAATRDPDAHGTRVYYRRLLRGPGPRREARRFVEQPPARIGQCPDDRSRGQPDDRDDDHQLDQREAVFAAVGPQFKGGRSRQLLPATDIGVGALAAFLIVGAERPDVGVAMLARSGIEIGPAPGIVRQALDIATALIFGR